MRELAVNEIDMTCGAINWCNVGRDAAFGAGAAGGALIGFGFGGIGAGIGGFLGGLAGGASFDSVMELANMCQV